MKMKSKMKIINQNKKRKSNGKIWRKMKAKIMKKKK